MSRERAASTRSPSTRKTSTRTENPSGADPSSTGAGDPSTRKPVSVELAEGVRRMYGWYVGESE